MSTSTTPKERSLNQKKGLRRAVWGLLALVMISGTWFASRFYHTGKSFPINVPANAVIYHDYIGINPEDPVDHQQIFFFYEKVSLFIEDRVPDIQDLLDNKSFFPCRLMATGFKQLADGKKLYYIESIDGVRYIVKF